MRLLTFPELNSNKGVFYCRVHIARLVASGKFPKPISLSDRRIAWIESEVDEWVAAHVQRRDHNEVQTKAAA